MHEWFPSFHLIFHFSSWLVEERRWYLDDSIYYTSSAQLYTVIYPCVHVISAVKCIYTPVRCIYEPPPSRYTPLRHIYQLPPPPPFLKVYPFKIDLSDILPPPHLFPFNFHEKQGYLHNKGLKGATGNMTRNSLYWWPIKITVTYPPSYKIINESLRIWRKI